jgi:enoyl-CoA hydratase
MPAPISPPFPRFPRFPQEQLHRPARTAIDAGAETDAKVRASWMSDDTRARVTAFIDALARDR